MLILATAVFVIILFFMNSLTPIVVGIEAQKMVEGYLEKTSTAVLSESLCFKTSVTVPESIGYFGGATQSEKRFFYVLKISSVKDPAQQNPASFIMGVANRQFQESFLAAQRIDVKANIRIFNWDTSTDTIAESLELATLIDPQAFPPINSFVLIKEVFRDETFLYVIPCSSHSQASLASRGTCVNNTEKVGCIVKQERGVASACVPKLENC